MGNILFYIKLAILMQVYKQKSSNLGRNVSKLAFLQVCAFDQLLFVCSPHMTSVTNEMMERLCRYFSRCYGSEQKTRIINQRAVADDDLPRGNLFEMKDSSSGDRCLLRSGKQLILKGEIEKQNLLIFMVLNVLAAHFSSYSDLQLSFTQINNHIWRSKVI